MDVVLKNATIVTHDHEFLGWLAIKGEKIAAIGTQNPPNANTVIDCTGKYIIPGVIDPHVHMGAWHSKAEDILTETRCALAGGVTTVGWYYREAESYFDLFPQMVQTIESNSHADILCHMGMQSELHARQAADLHSAFGTRCFKLHMGYEKGNSLKLNPANDGTLYLSLTSASKAGKDVLVSLHCENTDIIQPLKADLIEAGRDDLSAWTESRPSFCEEMIIRRALYLAELTGGSIYFPHTTIASGAKLAAEARAKGVRAFVETCPHYLTLSCEDIKLGNVAKVSPPLRDNNEIEAMWEMIREGYISCIGSDHVACDKLNDPGNSSIWTAVPGFAGLETLLPIMLSEGVNKGRISMQKMVEVTSYNAAVLFGLSPNKGRIQVGADADLVIVDTELTKTVHQVDLHSASTTPYEGMSLTGWPVATYLRGRLVYENGVVLAETGYGHCLNNINI